MTGIDPAPAMIDIARRGAYGDRVGWICGDAGRLPPVGADLAIMTGHVAQFFLTDESWNAALAALLARVRPGDGWRSARDPSGGVGSAGRESRVAADDPAAGRVETWLECQREHHDGIVSYAIHYVFAASAEEIVTANELRFRSLDELTRSLGVRRLRDRARLRRLGPPAREPEQRRAHRCCQTLGG